MRKKLVALFLAAAVVGSLLPGCGKKSSTEKKLQSQMITVNHKTKQKNIQDKYGSAYEIFVYSYYDTNKDGIGDLKGVTKKLDYINDGDPKTEDDLGCDAIWLMPIMPSTTYHKYDVTDYCVIDPDYGTMEDFDEMVEACHKRGIRVIIDFVMNHTSSKHPWFQEAVKYLKSIGDADPDPSACPYVNYYNFSRESKTGYTKIDGCNWYYESRFWSEMPDLNLENEAVRKEFDDITSFWFKHGVDGFRMDAASQYSTGNDGTNTQDLKWFNDMVKAKKSDATIVAEVWTSEDVYSKYLSSGIESTFDFDYAGSDGYITKTVRGTRGADLLAQSMQETEELERNINPAYVGAPFYVNHDMNRSAGYYNGDTARSQVEVSWGINNLMSGRSYLYYGEELGMKGSGEDPNKRLPMQWEKDQDASGMCKPAVGAEMQEMPYGSLGKEKKDAYSIYNYMKESIQLRNRFPLIARGETKALADLSTSKVMAIQKTVPETIPDGMSEEIKGEKALTIFVNTSGEKQTVKLTGELAKASLVGVLVTGKSKVEVKEGKLILPAYGTAILQ